MVIWEDFLSAYGMQPEKLINLGCSAYFFYNEDELLGKTFMQAIQYIKTKSNAIPSRNGIANSHIGNESYFVNTSMQVL